MKLSKTRRQKIEGPAVRRELTFRAEEAIIDEESRIIRVSFSSTAPVLRRQRWDSDWLETLGHENNEVILDRINAGAPVLYNHARSDDWSTRDTRIGVVQRAWLENGRGEAELKISRREDAAGYWQDIRDGVLCNVSVGYVIHERVLMKQSDDEPDEYRVTLWEPLEISLVDIPADYSVGVGRSEDNATVRYRIIDIPDQETPMDLNNDDNVTDDQRAGNDSSAQVDAEQIRKQAQEEERKREQTRRKTIRGVFEHFPQYAELRDQCLDDPGIEVSEARKLLLDEMGKETISLNDPNKRIDMGTTDREKFVRAAVNWLGVRAGLKEEKRDNQNELNGFSLRELLRRSLELAGIDSRGLDETQMLQRAIGHGASDFPAITENIANKAMMEGFQDANETYQIWTQTGSLSDFKIASRIDRGGFNSLREVKRGAEIKQISTEDRKEQLQLSTYAEMFSIDRQTIIDDDVGAFTAIPQEMGIAARGTIGDLVYGILIGNPNMSDGVALFHANHGNLLTGADIATSSTDAMRTAIGTQKRLGVTGRSSNIMLGYLLVPKALQGLADQVRTSQFAIEGGATDTTAANYMANQFEVVPESRLDDDDPAGWYGAARRRTVEVAYLNGRAEPVIERMDGWTVLGLTWRIYLDAVAKALDWRTMAKNPGA